MTPRWLTMIRLFYFPVPGRAEASRIALSLSGMEWEDIEVNGLEYNEMKKSGELPWGMLPVLKTENGIIAESSAILRYVGKIAGLIPNDPFQAAKADEFMDAMGPMAYALDSTFGFDDVELRIKSRENLFLQDGAATKALKLYDKKVGDSKTGWVAETDEMSIADVKFFGELFALFSGNYDGIEKSMIMEYKNLLAYHDKMANEPRILNHYQGTSKDNIRWTFLPNAFLQ